MSSDQQAVPLTNYQQAYQAAAQAISTAHTMFEIPADIHVRLRSYRNFMAMTKIIVIGGIVAVLAAAALPGRWR